MRRAIGIGLGAVLLSAMPAAAAVPLHMQVRGELHRIIDLRAFDRLGPIDRIERVGAHAWRVTLGACTVDVRMIERRGGPGYGLAAPIYEPRASRPVCRR